MTPVRGDGVGDVGKFLAQEIVTPGFSISVHMDADNHRIGAGDEEQLPVVVTRRPVKELGKVHRKNSARAAKPSPPSQKGFRLRLNARHNLIVSRGFGWTGSSGAASWSATSFMVLSSAR